MLLLRLHTSTLYVFNSFLPSTEGVGGGSGVQRMTETAKRAKFNVLARFEDIYFYFFISSSLSLWFWCVDVECRLCLHIYTSSSSFLQRAESWTSVKCFPFRQVGKVPRKRVKFLTTTFFTHFIFLLFSSHFIHSTSHLISSGVCSATTGQSSQLIYKIKSSQKSRDSDDSRERREWKMIKLFYFTQFTLSESELCARWCWCASLLCSFLRSSLHHRHQLYSIFNSPAISLL